MHRLVYGIWSTGFFFIWHFQAGAEYVWLCVTLALSYLCIEGNVEETGV